MRTGFPLVDGGTPPPNMGGPPMPTSAPATRGDASVEGRKTAPDLPHPLLTLRALPSRTFGQHGKKPDCCFDVAFSRRGILRDSICKTAIEVGKSTLLIQIARSISFREAGSNYASI